jgi:hypothetical protein
MRSSTSESRQSDPSRTAAWPADDLDADVNVFASSGVPDGRGSFGYAIYVKLDDYERAAAALGP